MKKDYRCCRSLSSYTPNDNDKNSLEYLRFIEMNVNDLTNYIGEIDQLGSLIYDRIRKIYRKRFPELELLIPNIYLYVATVLFLDEDFEKNVRDLPTLIRMLDPIIAKIIVHTRGIPSKKFSKEETEDMMAMRAIIRSYRFALSISRTLEVDYSAPDSSYFKDQSLAGIPDTRRDSAIVNFVKNVIPKLMKEKIAEPEPSQELLYNTQHAEAILVRIGRSIEHLSNALMTVDKFKEAVQLTNEDMDSFMNFLTNSNKWLEDTVNAIKAQFNRAKNRLVKRYHVQDEALYQSYNHHYEHIILGEMMHIRLNLYNKHSPTYYIIFCAHPEGKSIETLEMDIQEQWYREVFLKCEERLLSVGLSTVNELRAGKGKNNSFNNIINTYVGAHRADENLRLLPPYCTMLETYLKEMEKYYSENFFKDITAQTSTMETILSSDPKQTIKEYRAKKAQEAKRLFEKEFVIAKEFFNSDDICLAVNDFAFEILLKPFEDEFLEEIKTALNSLNGPEERILSMILNRQEYQAMIKTIFHEVLVEAKKKCYFENGEINQKELERIYSSYNMIVLKYLCYNPQYYEELHNVFEEFKPSQDDVDKDEDFQSCHEYTDEDESQDDANQNKSH